MTATVWLVAVLLVAAAAVLAWPVRGLRARRRAVLGAPTRPGPFPPSTARPGPFPPSTARPGPFPLRTVLPGGGRSSTDRGRDDALGDRAASTRPPNRRDSTRPSPLLPAGAELAGCSSRPAPSGASDPTSGPVGPRRLVLAHLPPRAVLLAVVLLGAGTGALLGGPVAAGVLAAYGALATRAVHRRRAHRSADRARRAELDQLCALAADLRAGLPATVALVDGPHRVARLARAAVRLADRTGAPLAELLERVEADARMSDRGLAAATAQAAGARATAWLLAALPLGGIGLGYAIGVDPVAVLLHTPIGGGSALAAVALQIGGLLWAERLGAAPGRAA